MTDGATAAAPRLLPMLASGNGIPPNPSANQLEPELDITRLRRELTTLACRVALLSEENEQLRCAGGSGRAVGLPSGGSVGS